MYDRKHNILLNENVCFIHKGTGPTDRSRHVGKKQEFWLVTNMSSWRFLLPLISSNYQFSRLRDNKQ